MRKLSLVLIILLSLGFTGGVVDIPQDRGSNRTASDGQRPSAVDSDFRNSSYIVELEGEPTAVAAERQERRPRDGFRLQSSGDSLSVHKEKLRETRRDFNRSLNNTVDRHFSVERKYETAFHGMSVSNISNSTVDEIEEMDEVENVYRDRLLHVQLEDSVPNIGAEGTHNTVFEGENLTGKGVEVAVLDTGIDYRHPDLGGCTFNEVNNSDFSDCRFLPGYDFVSGDYDYMDEREHGTHVAGIVGATGPDVKGVAPDAEIRGYRVCSGYGCPTSNIMGAIDRAMDPDQDGDPSDHVDILQMSIGGAGYPSDPMSQALNDAFEVGVVPVISAGNSGSASETVSNPATARKALAVGSVNDNDRLNQFSSRGPQKVKDSTDILFKPEISAPGSEVVSTVPGGGTKEKSGTSMAAPHVSGSAALLLQKYDNLRPLEVQSLLTQTSNPVETDNLNYGVDLLDSGNGRVNVSEALNTSSVVTPEAISFGLSNSTGRWWNTSKILNLTNFGEVEKSYSISANTGVQGAEFSLNSSSPVLEPGEDIRIRLNLSVDKEKLGEGEFTGKINLNSNKSEYLEISYLFVNQDFSIDVNPDSSREGFFDLKVGSPLDFDSYSKSIQIKRPDNSSVEEALFEKGLYEEWMPDNQKFEGEALFSQEGEYTATVNSSLVPGKEASTNFTVGNLPPELNDNASFISEKLNINLSSESDLGLSTGRRISLDFDHSVWQPEVLNYGGKSHIFWDHGGYNTGLRYSTFSGGRLNQVAGLEEHPGGQTQGVSVSRKGSKALVSWRSTSSSGDCDPYCNHAYSALIDLESESVEKKVNLTEAVPGSDIEGITSAVNGDKAVVGWIDDRANRSKDYSVRRNLSFIFRTFDFGTEAFSGEQNISYDEDLMQRSLSIKPVEDDFFAFWMPSREDSDINTGGIYSRKVFSNGTVGKETPVSGSFEDLDWSCEGLNSEAVCVWRQPTSDAGGELYSASSGDNWSEEFLDYSQSGALETVSSEDQLRTVYFNGSYETGYSTSYQERTYNGTWSKATKVLDDVADYEISSLSGVSEPITGLLKNGDSIPYSGSFAVPLDTFSLYSSYSSSPQNLIEPKYPISHLDITERNSSYFLMMDGKAHDGFLNWKGFSSTSNFAMRVSKRPEAEIVLSNGSTVTEKLVREEGKWQVNLSSDLGGTHIYRLEVTDSSFNTGKVNGYTGRNISPKGNSRPEKPDWRGVNGTVDDNRPLLNWTEAEDPDGDDLNYIMILDENENFSSPETIRNLENTSFRPEKLPNDNYSYSIYATDSYQDGKALNGSFKVEDAVNFSLPEESRVYEEITVGSNESGVVEVTRNDTDWSYTADLLEDEGEYSKSFELHNYGFYNITVRKEDEEGNILTSKTKKHFVNASDPVMKDKWIEDRYSDNYPVGNESIELNAEFDTDVRPLNASFTVSNSSWSKEFDASMNIENSSLDDYQTGEEYYTYSSGLYYDASSLSTDVNLSEGSYNVSASVSNLAGVSNSSFSLKVYEKRNLSVDIDSGNSTRTVLLFPGNQDTNILGQTTLSDEEQNISVPNITSSGENFSMAVTSRNLSNTSRGIAYIWEINVSLNDSIAIDTDQISSEERIGDRIIYDRFSTSYNGKNTSDKTKIYYARDHSEISNKVNSPANLTVYNCRNYSMHNSNCLSSWKEPDQLQVSNYSTLSFTGLVNSSEAVALGEEVRPCYPDCKQEQEEREDESDDSSSSSGGFTGGFTPPERPEVKSNGDKTTVENLEAGEASISSDPGINSVSISSSNAEYSMEIDESSSRSSEGLTEDYEVFESYDLSVSENGENVTDTEDEVSITFSVDKAWIDERNVSRDDVKLYHREQDSWETKETILDRVEDEKVFYRSNTTEFSDYMIAAEKEDKACVQEVTSARSPENTCRSFSTPCEVPENWTEVRSCELFEAKVDAEKALESLPENTSQEKVVEAREAFESGNYSEALEKAVEANKSIEESEEDESSGSGGLLGFLLTVFGSLAVIALVLAGSYVSYQRYRQRKMVEELNQITEIIRREMEAGHIERDGDLLELVESVRADVNEGRFDKADEDIEELRKALERSV